MAGEASTTEAATYPRGFSRDTDWKWPMVPARKLVTLNYGRALKADTRSPGKVPVFGTNGQCGWHDAPLAKAPGLILGRKGQGPLGVEWCDKDFWVIDTAYYASTLTPDIDLKYLYHLVKYVGLNHLKDGTSNPTLSRDTFGAQLFPLPPLAEQKAIAAVLGVLDDKIELNRRINATLEAMARALFQSWFVDFDPVRAKLDGRPPANLDAATAALFPASFQDSEGGHIPKGWTIQPVGEVVDCVGGGTPSTAEPNYWEAGTHHWTTPKDFSSLQAPVLLDTDRKLTDAGIAKISSGLLPAGTLLLSSRAPVGYLAVAAMPVAINQGFIAMKCNERASNYFMLNWSQTNMAEIESRATGTTFAEISKQNFRPIRVVLPPKELMAAFTAKVAPLYAQITANLRQSRTLATLRDTLLPKLLSGKVTFTKNHFRAK
jgi:type I restriction enzyme S subunit